MKTRADLVNRALKLLGVASAGQPIEAEDYAVADAAIEPKFAELARRSVIYVPNPDEIDDELLQWLAILIAQDVAPDFGAAMDTTAITIAESRLREMQPQVQTSQPIAALYF